MPSQLCSQSFVFDPRPRSPYLTTVKRYWHPDCCYTDGDAVTLILAHAIGAHKEQWEPTIEDMYTRLLRGGTSMGGVKIQEMWAIDAPNHGDAAVLNEEILQLSVDPAWNYTPTFSWEEYARAIHAFILGLGTGVDVDFSSGKLVAVGHSFGAVSMMLVPTFTPQITFHSMVLVEPGICRPPPHPSDVFLDQSAETLRRKDVWDSACEAAEYFSKSRRFKGYDPRVLEIAVKHSLRSLPTAKYPDDTTGVTLKCTREQEAATYRERIAMIKAWKFAPSLCEAFPVHFIYGSRHEYIQEEVRDALLSGAARGRYASCRTVMGAGHLIPQTNPEGLAAAVLSALGHGYQTESRARL